MNILSGLGVSGGIIIGRAVVIREQNFDINTNKISNNMIDYQVNHFMTAVETARKQLKTSYQRAQKSLNSQDSEIFLTHLDILEDPMITQKVTDKIKTEHYTAEFALQQVTEENLILFQNIQDDYLKERSLDIKNVSHMIMKALFNFKDIDLINLPDSSVIIAKDLSPSQIILINPNRGIGLATQLGGKTSHTAILAKSLEIPAVVGIGYSLQDIMDGDTIILDGTAEKVILNPVPQTIIEFQRKKDELEKRKVELCKQAISPAKSIGGYKVSVCANVGSSSECETVLKYGADGIGLYRTEFLYMGNTHFPSEADQFQIYKSISIHMKEKETVIRTLDIGGDKKLPYYEFSKEDNPFLGRRAIRFSFDEVEIFKAQLRAILRASHFGKIKIMFPMIISLEELLRAKKILFDCKNELENEGLEYDRNIEIGIMIETPAAVAIVNELAKEADFFSIGTNDLTQYTLAVDRNNLSVEKLYNSFHPAVLRSVKKVIDASHRQGKLTSMCGELAANEIAVALLLGMGLDEFSVVSSQVPKIKNIINKTELNKAQKLAEEILNISTTQQIINRLQKINKNVSF